ncbi:MAG TPA: hypothetical protein VFU05_17210 [Cyclobacteriaceae bacterium]|nr:hypothetical protein [Cyclobacteriaceae bacterium]
MLTKTNFCCFGFCVVLILSGCGPLVPSSYVNGNTNNQLTQTIETPEATVWLQFLRRQYNYYIFDLEVANHAEKPFSIAPQFISFYASPKKFRSPKDEEDVHALSAPNSALTMKRHFAASPTTIEGVYHGKLKEKRAGLVLVAIIGAGIILYDITEDAKVSKKESWTPKSDMKSVGRDLLVNVAITATDMANESAKQAVFESQYVPYELFPECTILPGKSVRGKIFIPIETGYRYSRVVVPFGDTDYVFDFKRPGN